MPSQLEAAAARCRAAGETLRSLVTFARSRLESDGAVPVDVWRLIDRAGEQLEEALEALEQLQPRRRWR